MQIEIRQALMRIFFFKVTKESKNKQGGSKEIGYQLKGDLSHMYRFLSKKIVDDRHPQRNMHI